MGDTSTSRRRMLALLGVGAVTAAAGVAGRELLTADAPGTASPPVTTRPLAGTRSGPSMPATTAPATTVPPTTTTTTPPPPYRTVDGEVFADAKLAACRVVEHLTTYRSADTAAAVVERAAAQAVQEIDRAALAERTLPLLSPGADSTGRIVYPQLGGLDPHGDPVRCSVMVVVAQRLVRPAGEEEVQRCVDVRLRRIDGAWRLEGLADTSRQPVPRPSALSDAAARALDHPGLDLPDSARWDVHEGFVDDRVLAELADLADGQSVAVTSFRRGHPDHVFGTTRLSAHTVGRAVDVWRIGGRPVVQQQPDTSSLAHAVARQVFDSGRITNLGSPWSFDGAGGRSFTDPVHHDHLHLGVSA